MSEAVQSAERSPSEGSGGEVHAEVHVPTSTGKTKAEQRDAPKSEEYGWREWASVTADLLGIISFGLMLYTLFTVSRLRRDILSRTRLPSHIHSLRGYATELSGMLNDLPGNSHLVNSIASRLDSTLVEIARLTEGDTNAKAKALRKIVNAFAKSSTASSRDGWIVYGDINGLVVALENVVANERVVPTS